MTETKISASDRYFDALNNIDQERFLSCFADDAEIHDPYGGRPFVGIEGARKWFSGFEGTWSNFSIEGEDPFPCGDRLAVKWTVRGEAKSGKIAEFSGIDVFTVSQEGLITRMDGYWDAPAMLAQIR